MAPEESSWTQKKSPQKGILEHALKQHYERTTQKIPYHSLPRQSRQGEKNCATQPCRVERPSCPNAAISLVLKHCWPAKETATKHASETLTGSLATIKEHLVIWYLVKHTEASGKSEGPPASHIRGQQEHTTEEIPWTLQVRSARTGRLSSQRCTKARITYWLSR